MRRVPLTWRCRGCHSPAGSDPEVTAPPPSLCGDLRCWGRAGSPGLCSGKGGGSPRRTAQAAQERARQSRAPGVSPRRAEPAVHQRRRAGGRLHRPPRPRPEENGAFLQVGPLLNQLSSQLSN